MSSTGRGATRDDLGRYYTDPRQARAVVGRMLTSGILHRGQVVLEPHVGGGVWLDALLDVTGWRPGDLELLAMDIDPEAPALRPGGDYRRHCGDFLLDYPEDWPRPDVALGNPPYSVHDGRRFVDVATPHCERTFDLEIRHTVYVLRAGFLGGPTHRRSFWRAHPCRELWSLWPRGSYTGKGTDSTEYIAMWWEAGWTGDTTHTFLEWRGGALAQR